MNPADVLDLFSKLCLVSNDVLLLTQPSGFILAVNNQAVEFYGWSEQELKAKAIYQLQGPDPSWYADFGTLKEKGHFRFETIHKTKTNSAIPVEVSSTCISFNDQEFVVNTIRNISE